MKNNNHQDSNAFKMIVKFIIAGAIIGSVIGVMGLVGIIPGDRLETVTEITTKICIGLIVLIIDLLFALGLCQPLIRRYIDKNGKQTNGLIEYVNELPRPDQLGLDEWIRKVRYSLTVKYCVDSKEYSKEFPPTHLTSKRELYPLSFEEGKEIPVKYLKRFPMLSILDLEILKAAWNTENRNARIHLIMIPLIITTMYVIAIIMI